MTREGVNWTRVLVLVVLLVLAWSLMVYLQPSAFPPPMAPPKPWER